MLLVHERPDKPGCFEVKWFWIPFFLAADSVLIRKIDAALTEKFKGKSKAGLEKEMHEALLDLLTEHVNFKGVRQYLAAIEQVELDATQEDTGKGPAESQTKSGS